MGVLTDLAARAWAHRKLRRNQCEWCSKPLPDVRPIEQWQACSEECALELFASATA